MFRHTSDANLRRTANFCTSRNAYLQYPWEDDFYFSRMTPCEAFHLIHLLWDRLIHFASQNRFLGVVINGMHIGLEWGPPPSVPVPPLFRETRQNKDQQSLHPMKGYLMGILHIEFSNPQLKSLLVKTKSMGKLESHYRATKLSTSISIYST